LPIRNRFQGGAFPALGLLLLLAALPARGEAPVAAPPGYVGLIIAPPRYELTLSPGSRLRRDFAVTARGYERAQTAAVAVQDWLLSPEGRLVPVPEGQNPYSARNWVRVSATSLTLKPGQAIEIPFEVQVPTNAPPGSYWTAITATVQPPPVKRPKGLVLVNRLRIWGVVYVTIAGTEQPDAAIQAFDLDPEKKALVLDVVNKGNVYLRLHPSLVFRDARGKAIKSEKLAERVLLRDGLVRYRIPLKDVPKEAVVAAVEVEAKGLVAPLYAEVALR